MKKQNKLMVLMLASAMAAAMAPVMTANAAADPIVVQAEGFSAFSGKNNTGAAVSATKAEDSDMFTDGSDKKWFVDWVVSIDPIPNFYDNNAEPTHGETGTGLVIAGYNNRKTYSVRLRNGSGNGQLGSVTYTIDAPYAGDYSMDFYGSKADAHIELYASVNGGDKITIKDIYNSYYGQNESTYETVQEAKNAATLTLNKGINTITLTVNGQYVAFDRFELNFTGEVPAEVEDKAAAVVENVYDVAADGTYSRPFTFGAIELSDYKSLVVKYNEKTYAETFENLGIPVGSGPVQLSIILTDIPDNGDVSMKLTATEID